MCLIYKKTLPENEQTAIRYKVAAIGKRNRIVSPTFFFEWFRNKWNFPKESPPRLYIFTNENQVGFHTVATLEEAREVAKEYCETSSMSYGLLSHSKTVILELKVKNLKAIGKIKNMDYCGEGEIWGAAKIQKVIPYQEGEAYIKEPIE